MFCKKLASATLNLALAFVHTLTLLAFLLAQVSGSFAKTAQTPNKPANGRLALVVGISEYSKLPGLKNPANDSALIAGTLRDLGFEVIEKRDLTLRQFASTIKETSKRARNYESVLFYFAGHGFQLDGRNYLVPSDAKLEDRSKIPDETLQLDGIIKDMESRNHNTLILLDACRNNPIPSASSLPVDTGGLAQIETGNGTFVAFATQPGNITRDGAGQNSPFSKALSEHMTTEGISISDMMIRVRNTVEELTLGTQTPWDQSSLRSQFYFNPAEESSETLTEEDLALLEQLDPALREKFMKKFGISVDGQSGVHDQEIVATISPSLRIEAAESEPSAQDYNPGTTVQDVSVSTQEQGSATIPPTVSGFASESLKDIDPLAAPRKPGLLVIALPDEELVPMAEPANPSPAAKEGTTLAMLLPSDRKVTVLAPNGGKEPGDSIDIEAAPIVNTPPPARDADSEPKTDPRILDQKMALAPKTVDLAPPIPGQKPPLPNPLARNDGKLATIETANLADKNETFKTPELGAPTNLALLTPPASPTGIRNIEIGKNFVAQFAPPQVQTSFAESAQRKSDEQLGPLTPSSTNQNPEQNPIVLPTKREQLGIASVKQETAAAPDVMEKSALPVEPTATAKSSPSIPPRDQMSALAVTSILTPTEPVLSPLIVPKASPLTGLPSLAMQPEPEVQMLAMAKPETGQPISPLGDIAEQEKTLLLEPEAGLVPLPDQSETEKRDLAIQVQNELSRLGCYRSDPDGDWGSKSARALLRFYAEQKLEPDQLEPTRELLDRISRIDQVVCKVTIAPKPKPAVKRSAPSTVQTAPAKTKPKPAVRQVAKPVVPPKPKPPTVAKAAPLPPKKISNGALIGAFR